MWRKYKVSMAAVIFFGLILSRAFFLYAAKNIEESPQFGGTLRIKAFSDVFRQNLDPAQDSHVFLIDQIYDGLVKLDNYLNIVPNLAEYWVISEDGKRYTFYLRQGVKFHQGRELTAEDVKFSLERLVHRTTGSLTSQFFTPIVAGAQEYLEGKAGDVAGFRVLDKYVFEIQWKAPYVSGLYLLSMSFCKILPRDLVPARGGRFFLKPSGTGAFKFAYWLRSPALEIVGVRLERNEEYFGKKAYVDAVEFSPHFTLDNFLEKEIDIIPFVSEKLAKMDCLILEGMSSTLVFLGVSCQVPPLDKQAVRQALSLAIDKKKLAQAAYTTALVPQVIHRFIPEKFPGFFSQGEREGYDPVKARQIFQEAGFSPENPLTLILFVGQPRSEVQSKFFGELEAQLSLVGVKLKLRYFSSLEEIKASGRPYLIKIDWILDFPDAENIIKSLFHSKSAFNKVLYLNPFLDRLLQEADVERSWTRRIELFHKMEQILAKDIPALPLFSYKQRLVLQPYVRGVKMPALGFYHLEAKDIWLDKRE